MVSKKRSEDEPPTVWAAIVEEIHQRLPELAPEALAGRYRGRRAVARFLGITEDKLRKLEQEKAEPTLDFALNVRDLTGISIEFMSGATKEMYEVGSGALAPEIRGIVDFLVSKPGALELWRVFLEADAAGKLEEAKAGVRKAARKRSAPPRR